MPTPPKTTNNLVSLQQAMLNPCAYWLMACYTYEELGHTIMSDATFDQLCAYIVDNWLDVSAHPHADLINPIELMAKGSSLAATKPRHEWPTITLTAAHHLLNCIYGYGEWGEPGASFNRMLDERFPCEKKEDWSDLA